MLHKGYSIKLWKSEWIGRRIDGLWYSLSGYSYLDRREEAKTYKYIALVCEINPLRSREIWGGSTPLIALDLAKFSIELRLANHRRWDIDERLRRTDSKCLKEYFAKLSKNT